MNPTNCPLKKQKEIKERVQEKEISTFWKFWGQGFRGQTHSQKNLPVQWHIQTNHGQVYYVKKVGQASKTEERKIVHEIKVHQTWGEYYGTNTGEEIPEKEEKEAHWEAMYIWKNECFWFWPGSSNEEGRLRRDI